MLTNYKLVDEYYDDEDPVITNKNDKNHTSKPEPVKYHRSLFEVSNALKGLYRILEL